MIKDWYIRDGDTLAIISNDENMDSFIPKESSSSPSYSEQMIRGHCALLGSIDCTIFFVTINKLRGT
jgi:hypothetical protein